MQLKGNHCKVSRDGCVEPSSSGLVQKSCHVLSLGNTLNLKKGPLPCKRGEEANDGYEGGDGSLLDLHWSKDVFALITYSCTLVLHLCLHPPHQLQQRSRRDRFSIYRHQHYLPWLQGSLNIPVSLAADNHFSIWTSDMGTPVSMRGEKERDKRGLGFQAPASTPSTGG